MTGESITNQHDQPELLPNMIEVFHFLSPFFFAFVCVYDVCMCLCVCIHYTCAHMFVDGIYVCM